MISIIIPVFNEDKNIEPLYNEIVSVLETIGGDFEIIFVNDGSSDATQEVISRLFEKDKEHIKEIQFLTQFGKAAALHAGFQMAKGEVIFTMDGDIQDDPAEIPRFLTKLAEGYDLVSGWKQYRKDSFLKNKTSKIFNAVTNYISKVKLHDFNCGFKAYRAEVAKGLNLYGELHRYIPVLVAARGYKVTEISIHHRKRRNGKSKYGLLRFIHGGLDIVTVMFITKFHARPLHFFGYVGLGFFSVGFLIGVYLTYLKFFGHQSIGERPLLLFSVMLIIMGVQIGITGLVSEQIATMSHKNEPGYVIKKVLKGAGNETT